MSGAGGLFICSVLYSSEILRQIKAIKKLSEAGHKINLFALRNPYDLSPDVQKMVSSSFACYEYSSRIFDEIALVIQNKGRIKGKLPVEV